MASLTRKYLKELGVEPEKIDLIIEAHVDSMEGVKTERDELKGKASEVEALTAKVKELEEKTATESEWKEKYETLSGEYENYKATQASEKLTETKEKAYKELLKKVGVSDSVVDLIMKGTSLDSLELDGEAIKNVDELTDSIKKEYAQFIVTEESSGTKTETPPEGADSVKDLSKLSMEEYVKARKNKENK